MHQYAQYRGRGIMSSHRLNSPAAGAGALTLPSLNGIFTLMVT